MASPRSPLFHLLHTEFECTYPRADAIKHKFEMLRPDPERPLTHVVCRDYVFDPKPVLQFEMFFLGGGISINTRGEENRTLLHTFVSACLTEHLRWILSWDNENDPLDFDAREERGWTPMEVAMNVPTLTGDREAWRLFATDPRFKPTGREMEHLMLLPERNAPIIEFMREVL